MLGIGCIAYQSDRCGELRPRDKVIQMRNDYDLEVFNGETGVVKKVDYSPVKAVLVEFPGPREVWYSAQQVEELDLAYSITAHRSQGSEFDAVVIPICRTLLYNVDKNVMYTAITRAKKRVVLVGDREALDVSLAQAGSWTGIRIWHSGSRKNFWQPEDGKGERTMSMNYHLSTVRKRPGGTAEEAA